MRTRTMLSAAVVAAALSFAPITFAQERNYTPGNVVQVSGIDIKDGQFETYLDYLATTWKKMQEFGIKEGYVVAYHVYRVNDPRMDEPDLYLTIEYKDYATTAQQEAFRNKLNAMLTSDDRKQDKAFGERGIMRTPAGSMEMQELKLK